MSSISFNPPSWEEQVAAVSRNLQVAERRLAAALAAVEAAASAVSEEE